MKRYSLNLRFAQMTTLDEIVAPGGATLTYAGLALAAEAAPSIALDAPWWKASAFTFWGEFYRDTSAGGDAWLFALETGSGDYTLAAVVTGGEIIVTDYASGAALRFPLPASGRFRLAVSVTGTVLAAAVGGFIQAAICDNAHANAATLLLGGNGTAGLTISHLAVLPNAASAALLPVLSELDAGADGAPDINAVLFPDGDPALWPDGDPMAWPG